MRSRNMPAIFQPTNNNSEQWLCFFFVLVPRCKLPYNVKCLCVTLFLTSRAIVSAQINFHTCEYRSGMCMCVRVLVRWQIDRGKSSFKRHYSDCYCVITHSFYMLRFLQ